MERRLTCLLCVLALAGLLWTGTALAAEPVLPLGTDGNGVHLTAKPVGRPPHRRKELVLTFDDSAVELWRQIAGGRLEVSCGHLARRPLVFAFDTSTSTDLHAPRRRKPIGTVEDDHYDVCSVGVEHRRRTTVLTEIPLTPRGATYLDELVTARVVRRAVGLLSRADRPSAAAVAAQLHGVALATPEQAPPPGVLGVYSDGAAHVYAAQTDRGGKLMFVERDDDVTRSDVLLALTYDDPPALAPATATGSDLARAQSLAPPLPIGTDGHGVRIVKRGRPARLVVRLSPQRYRAVAGNTLAIMCAPAPRPTLGGGLAGGMRRSFFPGFHPRGGEMAFLHAPRRRQPLVTRLAAGWDWCVVGVWSRHGGGDDVSFATVPLTPAGAAFADERTAAYRVLVSAFRLATRPAQVDRLVRRMDAVVLASPAETPPPGRLGIYSDGSAHVYAAQSDRAGDLLFYERDGDVVRTNLLRYLQDLLLLLGVDPSP